MALSYQASLIGKLHRNTLQRHLFQIDPIKDEKHSHLRLSTEWLVGVNRYWCRPFSSSLIHSFILNIYIAPFQENYSEALPTPARLKGAVLRWEKKRRWQGSRENPKFRREPIPDRGTHHGKARLCLVEVRANGTRRRPCWDEWRRGQQSSWRETGARPSKQQQTLEDTLSDQPVMRSAGLIPCCDVPEVPLRMIHSTNVLRRYRGAI